MSSDVELRANDLKSLLEQLNAEVAAVGSLKPDKRGEAVSSIKEKLERAKREYRMVDMEVRVLTGDEKTVWKNKLKEYQKQMNAVESELKWASSASPDGKVGQKDVTESQEAFTDYGRKLITETKETTTRVQKDLEDIEGMGTKIATTLKEDTERIQKMTDELYAIEDTVKRANAITRRMLRKVASDRYMWCLVFLIVVAIVFIIVWQVLNPDKKIDLSDSASGA